MSVLTSFHTCNLGVVSNNEFLALCRPDPEKKKKLAKWLSVEAGKRNSQHLATSGEFLTKLSFLINTEAKARDLLNLGCNLLPWSSKLFDLTSVKENWDFSNTVYSVIKREYPLQVIVPNLGGKPVLAVDVDRLLVLKQLPSDHPMQLQRLWAHELVHLNDIKTGVLYSRNNQIYYYDQLVTRSESNTLLDYVASEVDLPHERRAYQAQLKGLIVNQHHPYEMATLLCNNPIPQMEEVS